MPSRDGTGPPGGGSQTGRKLGWCVSQGQNLNKLFGKNPGNSGLLPKLIVPIGGLIITDLLRPDGYIKRISGEVVKQLNTTKQHFLPKPEK